MGGTHVGAHRNPDKILALVRDLLPVNVYDDLEQILISGTPGHFNHEGTWQQFLQYWRYGNHLSVENNIDKITRTMNKEDAREYVLTFPKWLAPFVPNLALMLSGRSGRPAVAPRTDTCTWVVVLTARLCSAQ